MKFITLTSFTLAHEAHFAKAFLEANEIEVFLKDELTTQVATHIPSAIGGVKLQVKEEDANKAYQLLIDGGYVKPPKAEPFETIYISSKAELKQCPYCHSSNVSLNKKPHWTFIFVLLWVCTLIPIRTKHFHCYDCHKDWLFRIKKM